MLESKAFTSLRDGSTEVEAKIVFVTPSKVERQLRLIVTTDGNDRQQCYIFKEALELSGAKVGNKCLFMLEPSKDGNFINVVGIAAI